MLACVAHVNLKRYVEVTRSCYHAIQLHTCACHYIIMYVVTKTKIGLYNIMYVHCVHFEVINLNSVYYN